MFSLMLTDLADLRGLRMDLGMLGSRPADFAAIFTALSTSSLPSTSRCPGTNVILVVMFHVSIRASILQIAEMRGD